MAFSPDGKTIAAGYLGRRRGAVGRGHARTPRRRPAPREGGIVWSVAFSADGMTIAAGYKVAPRRGRHRAVGRGRAKRLADGPLPVTEGSVRGVAFSPDGKTIAAGYDADIGGSGSGGVVLWDVATRKRLLDDPLPGEESVVGRVAFSPDGKTVATRYEGAGGGVVLWDVDLESWQRIAGRIANRNFTWDEWGQFFPDEPKYRPTFPDLPVPPEGSLNHANSPAASSK